jgi:hypothetical protein
LTVPQTNQLPPGAVPGALTNISGAPMMYDAGTMVSIGTTGRYKVFSTPFAAAPAVILTVQRSTGTRTSMLVGRPVAGSFQARIQNSGSATLHYMAFGAR